MAIVGGIASAIGGGKFATGALTESTIFEEAPPLLKGGMSALLGGLASKAAAGEFEQGALAALMVWVYNESRIVQVRRGCLCIFQQV